MPRVGPSAGAITLVMAVVKEDRVLFEGYIK
jgi:16S rRNA C1402 (ribose-2'-O) methylase RsmI